MNWKHKHVSIDNEEKPAKVITNIISLRSSVVIITDSVKNIIKKRINNHRMPFFKISVG